MGLTAIPSTGDGERGGREVDAGALRAFVVAAGLVVEPTDGDVTTTSRTLSGWWAILREINLDDTE